MSPQFVALLTAFSYASALVSARRGLNYSTPATVTLISAAVQNVTLWGAIFLTGGIPTVSLLAIYLFIFVGLTQLGVRLLAYTGVDKIGASRSSALQSISPLISAFIAIPFLRENASAQVLAGTCLVVIGIVLLSWKAEEEIPTFRWWHMLLPVGAAFLTGVNHPIRRYALMLSNEPLFFAAVMGSSTLVGFAAYFIFSPAPKRIEWHRKAICPFLITGAFETLAILLIVTALSIGPVVLVAPIAATYPMWALLGTIVFLRDLERIRFLTVMGSLSVVVGTVAIHLGS